MGIYKHAVIGWVVLLWDGGSSYDYLSVRGLAADTDGFLDREEALIYGDKQVIGVLSASPGTYKVYGVLPDGHSVPLGYEFPGISVDWHALLAEATRDWEKRQGTADGGSKGVNQ